MPTVADLTRTDPTTEASAAAVIRTALTSWFPGLVVDGGPAADLTIAPAAAVLAAVTVTAATANESLSTLLSNGTDPSTLTTQLAAAGVTVSPATKASGLVTISLPSNTTTSLLSGNLLTAGDGTTYKPTLTYQIRPTTWTPTGAPNEVVLVQSGSRYTGTITVTAVSAGAIGNRAAGVSLTLPSGVLPSGSTAYVGTGGLTGGADADGAPQLLAKLASANYPADAGSVPGIRNTVATVAPSATVNVLRYGDPALTRAYVAVGVAVPGYVDVYARQPGSLDRIYVNVTATLVALSGGFGVWQFVAPVPGCGYLETAYQNGMQLVTPGYSITPTGRGYTPSIHAVLSGADGCGTAYATMTGRFTDPDTSVSGLTIGVSTRAYTVSARGVAIVPTVQTALDAPTALPAGADVLVRGPIPVSVTLTVTLTGPTSTVVSTSVAAAVAVYINGTGFGLTLTAANIQAAVAAVVPSSVQVAIGMMTAVYYDWTGLPATLSNSVTLIVPSSPTTGLTANTVSFYCDASSVTVVLVPT